MSPQLANIHRSIYDAINLSKRQQWTITNYVVLVYGAIFGLSRYFSNPTIIEKCVLTLLALGAGGYAVWLLILIQMDLRTYRKQLESIHDYWLTNEERGKLKLTRYRSPTLRGGWFLGGLIGVLAIGFVLLAYSFLWHTENRCLWIPVPQYVDAAKLGRDVANGRCTGAKSPQDGAPSSRHQGGL